MAPDLTFRVFDANLPRFEVPSSHITILHSPSQFRNTLLTKTLIAERQIVLTSLYIGADAQFLLSAVRTSLVNHKNLKIFILLDCLRGTRPDPGSAAGAGTSASLLSTLVNDFGSDRVQVRFYHTPNLRGLWKHVVPQRLNEGFGLQHIKLCAFDDDIIVTGANLSHEYFTNRQDRYYVFQSAALTSYLCGLIFALGRLSYLLLPQQSVVPAHEHTTYTLEWPKSNYLPLPLEETGMAEIHEATTQHIIPLIWKHPVASLPEQPDPRGKHGPRSPDSMNHDADTLVYPLGQLAPLLETSTNVAMSTASTHEWALFRLLALLPESRSWTLATPYLKLPPELTGCLIRHPIISNRKNPLLNKEPTVGKIIVAAPEAMSFYGAKGLAGYIPGAFQREAQKLLSVIESYIGTSSRGLRQLSLLQWQRGIAHQATGWTFHAKGWWIQGLRSGSMPSASQGDVTATMVGSSNYGERSFTLDLEVDVLIVTTNSELKKRIYDEENRVLSHGTPVTKQDDWQAGILNGVLVMVFMWIIWVTGLSI